MVRRIYTGNGSKDESQSRAPYTSETAHCKPEIARQSICLHFQWKNIYGGTDEEKIGEGHNGGDPDEDSGDVIDEYDYQDEGAASGEEDGSQDGDNHEDEDSGSRKRKSSIPEEEEQDDKEEMEEDENEEKKKKRRKKRKRKQKSRKTVAETTEDVKQDGSSQSCDKRDEQIIVCQVGLNCESSTTSHVDSTIVSLS